MNLTTLFEKTAGKQKQRERGRANDFRGLVTAIATGKQPDPDHIIGVLHDAGKTLDDLCSAVEVLQSRRAMRKHLNSLPKLQAEEKEIGRQIAEADAALARAEDTHQETTCPLAGRLQQVRDAIREAEWNRQQLVATCTDPALLAQAAELAEKRRQANERKHALTQAINNQRGPTSYRVGDAEAGVFQGTPERWEYARRAEAKVAGRERELVEVNNLLASLEMQEAALKEQTLVP
jgi:putative intracellular protease/amidase